MNRIKGRSITGRGAVFVLLFAAFVLMGCDGHPAEGTLVTLRKLRVARVSSVSGSVTAMKEERERALRIKEYILSGESIVTGSASYAELELSGGGGLRVNEGSNLRLLRDREGMVATLTEGSVSFYLKEKRRGKFRVVPGPFTLRGTGMGPGATTFLVIRRGERTRVALVEGALVALGEGRERILDLPGEIAMERGEELFTAPLTPLSSGSLRALKGDLFPGVPGGDDRE